MKTFGNVILYKILCIMALIMLGIPTFAQHTEPIRDELLEPSIYGETDDNSIFKLGIYKHGEYKYIPIEDELIDQEFITNASNLIILKKEAPDDFFFEKMIDTSKVRKILPKVKYDFTKQQVPVHIKLANHIKSTKGLSEGNVVPFVTTNDFEIEGKKFEKGTPVFGRIEMISASDKMGTPESIKIDNFYIKDEDKEINLHGSVSKTGANRSIWVYPLYQAGNVALYVAGFVFVPIHGGRVKLSATEAFIVFYETE